MEVKEEQGEWRNATAYRRKSMADTVVLFFEATNEYEGLDPNKLYKIDRNDVIRDPDGQRIESRPCKRARIDEPSECKTKAGSPVRERCQLRL